jgi:protocadherin Fat 1/2/3
MLPQGKGIFIVEKKRLNHQIEFFFIVSTYRFLKLEPAAEIFEKVPIGTFVTHLEARSTSSLLFEITNGNTNDVFFINPSTGIITTKDYLDYETNRFFNLTVQATNMASASANCFVIVHVLDANDNAPYFEQEVYRGEVAENVPIGSLVIAIDNFDSLPNVQNTTIPLVIKARDNDSGLNALLHYDIVELLPRRFFHIDSTTGAIKTVMFLDHEKIPFFSFHVKVSDFLFPHKIQSYKNPFPWVTTKSQWVVISNILN